MQNQTSTTKVASRLIYFPKTISKKMQRIMDFSKGGVFVGISEDMGEPYFINFERLVNPHVFIVGMTGSGKSYLIRNLMLRLYAIIESRIVLIDFTGEYNEDIALLKTKENCAENITELEKKKIFYTNLSGKEESAKIAMANSILEEIAASIRNRQNFSKRIFVILDEAWKLVKSGGSLEILLREGRKYGVGIIFASQLIEDIELAKIANIATIFVFRTQNKQSLDRLRKNYNLSDALEKRMQNLDVGSCILIQLYKSEKREASVINRVLGIDFQKPISIGIGDSMTIEVDRTSFENKLRKLAEGRNLTDLLHKINESHGIELHELIQKLILLGIDSNKILSLLRSMRIGDYDITDAFAVALDRIEADKLEERQK